MNGRDSLILKKSVFSKDKDSQYRKFLGEIMLPAEGYWRIAGINPAGNITEIYLVPSTPFGHEQVGARMAAVIEEKENRKGRYLLSQVYWSCSDCKEA